MIVSNKKFIVESKKAISNHTPHILVSGGFEIFHEGHLEYLEKANGLIDWRYEPPQGTLFIVLNGDEFIKRKHKRAPVFSEKFRAKLLNTMFPAAYITIYNKRDDMSEVLEQGFWQIFGNGGDRKGAGLKKEEIEVCKRKKIKMVCLGTKKLNSTSDIIRKIQKIKVST